jgi:hypothetical protein
VEPLVTVTDTPAPEIETGPALIPFSVPAKVIEAVMVFAFVRITESTPNEGPPAPAIGTPVAKVRMLIHAEFAEFLCLRIPVVVSAHHIYAYIVVGSVVLLNWLTTAEKILFKSVLTLAPVSLLTVTSATVAIVNTLLLDS